MAFTGPAYKLVFSGSFNGSENIQLIPKESMITGSRNINSHNGGLEKRGGTETVGSQVGAGPDSLGGGMLIKRSAGSKHVYFAGVDGVIYRDGVSVKTGRNTTAYNHYTTGDDEIFICNGKNPVQVDTGSAIADISAASADWTGSAQPTGCVVHAKGASRRMFFWGVTGKEDTLYYSSLGAFQTNTGGTSGTIVIDTQHGDGITNCISKDGVLFIFSKNNVFILEDSSTTVSTWGSFSAAVKGGCFSPRHAVVIKNQIFSIDATADIYEVLTGVELRDYKRASIVIPFELHNYIKQEWDIAKIDQWHLSYEPRTQSLRIGGVRLGQSEVDTHLVYYVNQNKWASPHDSIDNSADSGLQAASAFAAESSDGESLLYTQDYNGFTWLVESTTKSDNGNGYNSIVSTPWLEFDLHSIQKRWPYAILHYKTQGNFQLTVDWFVDDVQQATDTVTLGSTAGTLGSFILDTDVLGTINLTAKEFTLRQQGEKIRFLFSNSGAGEDFFLSHLIIPFIARGLRRL